MTTAGGTLRTTAFLFPGQGSQAVGMGRELAAMYPVAQETFDEADAALGYKLSQLCWEGPEERLKMTEVTQPAILTVSVAAFRVLREKGIAPNLVAGHSLGEYSAHVAAGTLTFDDAVRIVRNRGRYMQEAVPTGLGAMAAILALSLAEVEKVCAESAQGEVVSPANINSPGQIVISGTKAAVERAAELAKQRGAKRAVMLPVSAPFHCALMQPAQDRLATELKAAAFHPMNVPLVTNVDAEVITSPDNVREDKARDALIRQVTGAVRWTDCVQALIAKGTETFVEVGPGTVLGGLMRQIDRAKTCLNVEDETSLQRVVNHFEGASLAQR
ncbi:MAG: ACP S-malonyltransferase [Acidobacteriota bacterium]|nr:ACP S-malonyltransferase [Acidobacteriota bacterium]